MKKNLVFIISFLVIALSGCEDSSSTNGYVIDFRSGAALFEMPEGVRWQDVTSRMILMNHSYYDADSLRTISEDKATAYFYTEQRNFTDAGHIYINGYLLHKISANDMVGFTGPLQDIIKIGTAYERKIDVDFGGEEYKFRVEGSKDFNPL